jgi:hypothetical protein
MADPKGNLPTEELDQSDTEAETPSAAGALPGAGATVKVTAGKGSNMSVPGATSMDEAQTMAVLERLQKYVDEKDSNKGVLNPLMKGLNLGYATTYGPDSLQRAQAQYDLQDKDVQNTLGTMGSLASSLSSNKAFLQAANAAPGGGSAPAGGPGSNGTIQMQGTQLSPIDRIIAGLPPTLQDQAEIYKKMGTRAGYDEIFKMGREYETKGRTSESKNRAEIFAMPEGPEKDIAMQEFFSKAYNPVSTFQGGFESKTSGAGAARGAGGYGIRPPSTSFVDSAAAAGIPVISGVRTPAQQDDLRDHRDPVTRQWLTKEGRPVADNSKHFTGNAIDVDPSKPLGPQEKAWLQANAYQPDRARDANHWEMKPQAAAAAPTAAPRGGITPAGVPGGTVEGARYQVEQATAQNNMDRDAIVKPLREKQQANLALPSQIDSTLATVEKGKFGPGTRLHKFVLETEGMFTNLSKKELKELTDSRTLESTAKKLILADAKGSLPGSFSDSDRAYIDSTGASIDDTKDFIKATLQLKKASILANNDLANFLSKPQNSGRIAEAYQQYQDSGRGMEILRQNAPTLFKYEKKAAENKAPATVHTDDAARAWLAKNPNDPKAAAVRKSLEGK